MVKKTLPKHNNQTNVLAILSLIFGVLFFIPFAPILAIVFGFIALGQINRTREQGRGMAIIGIILGFVWILLLILLILLFLLIFSTVIISVLPVFSSIVRT